MIGSPVLLFALILVLLIVNAVAGFFDKGGDDE